MFCSLHCSRGDFSGLIQLLLVVNGLSSSHRDYLAAGGLGFILGDGQLQYGAETILETYYSLQVIKVLSISLDHQFVANPGYNQERGPVNVFSFRVHLEASL